jgi:hypothetical protein
MPRVAIPITRVNRGGVTLATVAGDPTNDHYIAAGGNLNIVLVIRNSGASSRHSAASDCKAARRTASYTQKRDRGCQHHSVRRAVHAGLPAARRHHSCERGRLHHFPWSDLYVVRRDRDA